MDNNNPVVNELRQMYTDARSDWHTLSSAALQHIESLALTLERNLGEISWDEAVDALKRLAVEELEKIR